MAVAEHSRTVVLLANTWRQSGGLEAVVMDLAWALHHLGWRVKVFSVFGKDDEAAAPECEVVSLCPPGRLLGRLWHRLLWRPVTAHRVRRALDGGGLLIFGHAHLLPLLDVLPAHGVQSRWAWVYGLEVWGEQALLWTQHLNRLDRIVSISAFTYDQLRAAGVGCPIDIVPCCVDTDAFTPTETPERIRRDEVLICGRMVSPHRDKGHETLFRSLPIADRLLGRRISVRVVGTGADQPRLQAMARELCVQDRVQFVGRLSMSDLLEAYRHCGVFCMPTRVDRKNVGCWNGEGFGIVYVEAAACGRPVIASTEGGAPETIVPGETGLLADPRSADSVASAIAQVLGDPARAAAMGRQGRLLAESRFSRRQFVERLRRMLEELGSQQEGTT